VAVIFYIYFICRRILWAYFAYSVGVIFVYFNQGSG
jgi:hypothetical protein